MPMLKEKPNTIAVIINTLNILGAIGSFIITAYNVFQIMYSVKTDASIKIKNRNKRFGF